MTETTRLKVYSRDEWSAIVHRLWPDLEEAEFERLWAEFCRMKEQRALGRH